MKAKNVLVICLVLTAGAFYGRFRFLRDRGFIRPEATFMDYVLLRADRVETREAGGKAEAPPPAPKPEPRAEPDEPKREEPPLEGREKTPAQEPRGEPDDAERVKDRYGLIYKPQWDEADPLRN